MQDVSSACLKSDSCKVSRSIIVEDGNIATIALHGYQRGCYTKVSSYMKDGDLSNTQELAIGNSIEASQGADMDAIYGEAYSEAEDSEG